MPLEPCLYWGSSEYGIKAQTIGFHFFTAFRTIKTIYNKYQSGVHVLHLDKIIRNRFYEVENRSP